MLRIQPVRSKPAPGYPTHDYLREHPELLSIVPERWRQNPLVLRILGSAAFLILISQTPAAGQQRATPAGSRIAPLFLHGDGRGAFGCVAVNPPVFLSEDEARQVVREEAKKAGLDFAPDAFTVHDANVPNTDPYVCGPGSGELRLEALDVQKRDLVLDGFDQKRNVGFEFVSGDDFTAWKRKNTECVSSVSSMNMKGTAERLRAGLARDGESPWIGVFYEPAAPRPAGQRAAAFNDKDWEDRRNRGRELGKEELRRQVRDFIHWLRAQGVI